MQGKVRPKTTPYCAANHAEYMEDTAHKRHVGKLIESRFIGCQGPLELQLRIAEVAYGRREIRRGPRVKNAAYEFEGGAPHGFLFIPEERRLIETRVVTKLDIVACLFSWHWDPKRRREDFHCLAPNRDSRGRPLSTRYLGKLRLRYRNILDEVHDEINRARVKRQAQPIPTMKTIRDRQITEGREYLLIQLAESDVELDSPNLVKWLEDNRMLGKKHRLKGDKKDYVSVVYIPERGGRQELLGPLLFEAKNRRKERLRDKKLVEADRIMKEEQRRHLDAGGPIL